MTTTRQRDYLHALRAAELDGALALLPPGFDLAARAALEIGGADGHVARLLAGRCRSVEAVDVALPETLHYPVRRYDGHRLPFADNTFDLIYSSHVMEHVAHFAAFQGELARVLRPDGLALHVVPTAVWRFWTLLAHYPALPQLVAGRLAAGTAPGAVDAQDQASRAGQGVRRRGAVHVVTRLLAAAPHGETGSAIQELAHFSMSHWRRRFRTGGWRLADTRPLDLFYTGYMLAGGRLSLAARRRLARLAGASSGSFLLAPPR